MAYIADTFVAGEQPTTAKWNELWGNDSAFNDGTGIAAGAIGTSHLAANSITTTKLASGSGMGYRLGFAEKNSTGTTLTTAYVTYLTVTVTTLASEVEIQYGINIRDGASGVARSGHVRIEKDGSIIGSDSIWQTATSSATTSLHMIHSDTPTAASHTYTLQVEADTSSASLLDLAYLRVVQLA